MLAPRQSTFAPVLNILHRIVYSLCNELAPLNCDVFLDYNVPIQITHVVGLYAVTVVTSNLRPKKLKFMASQFE